MHISIYFVNRNLQESLSYIRRHCNWPPSKSHQDLYKVRLQGGSCLQQIIKRYIIISRCGRVKNRPYSRAAARLLHDCAMGHIINRIISNNFISRNLLYLTLKLIFIKNAIVFRKKIGPSLVFFNAN